MRHTKSHTEKRNEKIRASLLLREKGIIVHWKKLRLFYEQAPAAISFRIEGVQIKPPSNILGPNGEYFFDPAQ